MQRRAPAVCVANVSSLSAYPYMSLKFAVLKYFLRPYQSISCCAEYFVVYFFVIFAACAEQRNI
jgi:hypothetical protein